MPTDRPNILLIMSDQHNRRVAGCYGDAVVSTPHLDRLAAEGVVFDSAYCPFPLCAPARMAFMTGRNASEIRAYDNSAILHSDTPTFAHALAVAGYETVLCGRMHFNGGDQRHGFGRRIFPEVSGHAAGMLVDTTGFSRPSLEKSGPGRNHYLLYDELCVEEAGRWLHARTRDGGEEPFCLVVGLVGPHCPFVCPPELFRKYFDAVDVPEYSAEHFEQMHPYYQRMRQRSVIDNATEHEIRRTRAAYYGMVGFDDRLVGSLLDALEGAGLREDTAVVYTADHGDMAGEHGMWWKMSFYEGSVGVPLIASLPGTIAEGAREPAAVSLIDLAPTLAELGGGPQIPGVTGRSLLPHLRGERADPDRAAFSEVFIGRRGWRDCGPCGGPARMLRRGRWKCAYYHDERPTLYDLEADPRELQDRAQDPACAEVLEAMLAEILADWDPEALQADMEALVDDRELARGTPGGWRAPGSEYWKGPADYGHVEPV